MWLNLQQIFTRLSHDPSVRAILLTGAGPRAFTTGLDVQAASATLMSSSSSDDAARTANRLRRHVLEFQDCITAVEKCEKPVVCLLHGFSFGLGIDLSLATDIRIALQEVRMSVKEVDIGIAADIGTLSRLPKSVGSLSWVKDVTMTGRVFGAEEAEKVGLVSKVVKGSKEDGVKEALELCKVLASKSPVAVMGTKEIINFSRDRTVEDGLRYTSAWNAAMLQTDDVSKAVMAGMAKSTPTFEKL
jgi:Delta3,5-Delta2,4-dienoyl-CoA isomerase